MNADIVAFQTDITSVENQQPDRLTRNVGYILLALFVLAVLWASLAQIDRVVIAQGKIITTTQNIVIQPLDRSIIRTIPVSVGQIVKAGETLVTLDPTFAATDLAQAQQKLNAARLQALLFSRELAGEPFEPSREFSPDMAEAAKQVYAERHREYTSRVSAQDQVIQSIRVNIESTRKQIVDYERQLAIVKEVEGMRRELFERGCDSRLSLLLAENNLISVNTQWIKAVHELKDYEHSLEKAAQERDVLISNWRKDAQKSLLDAIVMRDELVQQVARLQRSTELVTLSAPEDAIVLDIGDYSIGSVVREANPIMTLVPINQTLEAEVNIDPADVGYVRTGDVCRIKMESFPFQKHGMIEGIIRVITEDTIQISNSEAQTQAKMKSEEVHPSTITYKARISLTKTSLNSVPKDFRLIPGMPLAAEIKVGHRSVISYFLYPIIRTMDESLREP